MSYITVSAELVKQCCNNWKAYWQYQNAYNASAILRKAAKEKKYLFFGPEIGYQAAFDYLENSADFGASLKWSACFWNGETDQIIDNLLLLADNGDPVNISDNQAFIFKFKDK